MRKFSLVALFAISVCAAFGAHAEGAPNEWITQSNRYAKVLMDLQALYNPEAASANGIEGHDADVIDLKPQVSEREESDLKQAVQQLAAARSTVTDARVKQDLDILATTAENQAQSLALNRRLMVSFFDLPQALFGGFQKLLHEGVSKDRQAQGILRLHRYAGREAGYDPITTIARARIEETLKNPELVAPWSVEIQESLDNQRRYIEGIRDLFAKSGLKAWQGDFKILSRQVDDYGKWVTARLLPRARKTNRLPEPIYADNLKNYGVDADPRALMQEALTAYTEIREELSSLARQIAEKRGFSSAAYPDVIGELKKDKIPQDRMLEIYRERLAAIEQIVRDRRLATLPAREAVIRFGSEAESAATPAPHIDAPRLIGNTGEPAAFVIPVSNPNSRTAADLDDFSFDAVTWALTAHEARPGHELQFSRMLEHGVSAARALFAFNSANVEGWALYSEAFMRPYFPLEGQLGDLQLRLLRAARAFLDPMLNLGMIEPETAKQLLLHEVCLSEPMAKQEVDRYTFRAPGQATSYFYGYQRLEAMRAKAEIALGDRFDLLSYHDFILTQGLLPLQLLDRAVTEEYVAARH